MVLAQFFLFLLEPAGEMLVALEEGEAFLEEGGVVVVGVGQGRARVVGTRCVGQVVLVLADLALQMLQVHLHLLLQLYVATYGGL